MNTGNIIALSKELEAAQIHLNKLAGQIMDAAAELENLWTRIDLATVQLADPAELRESARRVLEQEATPQDRASLLDSYNITLPEGASRKDALFAIADKLAESTQDQTADNAQDEADEDEDGEEIIFGLCDIVDALRLENEDLRAQLDALTANR